MRLYWPVVFENEHHINSAKTGYIIPNSHSKMGILCTVRWRIY